MNLFQKIWCLIFILITISLEIHAAGLGAGTPSDATKPSAYKVERYRALTAVLGGSPVHQQHRHLLTKAHQLIVVPLVMSPLLHRAF